MLYQKGGEKSVTKEGGKAPWQILNRDIIKYIAMITMLLNHIATIFLERGTALYVAFIIIGYFTAITMIYFLVEGYSYTHSKKAYISRLFLFAVLSEIPYRMAFATGGTFCNFNMLVTLCICFGILYVLETVKQNIVKICLLLLGIFCCCFCDWSFFAPLFTLLFAWAGTSDRKKKIAFALSVLLFGVFQFVSGIGSVPVSVNLLRSVLSVSGMAASGICILFLYNGERMHVGSKFSKWFFYLFYPVHLWILGSLRLIFLM